MVHRLRILLSQNLNTFIWSLCSLHYHIIRMMHAQLYFLLGCINLILANLSVLFSLRNLLIFFIHNFSSWVSPFRWVLLFLGKVDLHVFLRKILCSLKEEKRGIELKGYCCSTKSDAEFNYESNGSERKRREWSIIFSGCCNNSSCKKVEMLGLSKEYGKYSEICEIKEFLYVGMMMVCVVMYPIL